MRGRGPVRSCRATGHGRGRCLSRTAPSSISCIKQTGVYDRSKTGKTPDFVSDPTWPRPLPHSWLLGQIGGLYVDSHDHVWVYNRPRTLNDDEVGLEKALPGVTDAKGQPVNALGFARVDGFGADCCRAAPSVLEFDADGKLLRSWGGPADPGFLGGKCKAEDGCIWPNSEHGIYVDEKDNVWIAGNAAAPKPDAKTIPWTTNKAGGDGFILKFDMDGNFKMRIGGTPSGPDSNNKDGGMNGTPLLYQPADMVVDPKTNRLYVADGYGNRRILIVDADTGKYIGHFGAYGNNPIDDAAAAAAGAWPQASAKGEKKPAFFRNPVHCVKIADDGKLYVCDRGNDRIQVFDAKDPDARQRLQQSQWRSRQVRLRHGALGQRQHLHPAGDAGHRGVDELLHATRRSPASMSATTPTRRSTSSIAAIWSSSAVSDAAAGWPAISTGCIRSASTAKATSTPARSIPENACRSSSATAPMAAAARDRPSSAARQPSGNRRAANL